MTTTPPDSNDDLVRVLTLAGCLPDEITPNNLTIADSMLHRANGSHQLAAQYFRAYRDTYRRPAP